MYVYIKVKDEYRVGFYDPKGKFHVESIRVNVDAAARRVNYLNGGPGSLY